MEEPIAASPEVENQRNLRRLMLSIRSSFGKLNLLIAICDNPKYRDELIQGYEAELAAQGVDCARVRLDRKTPSLKDALLGLSASGTKPQVVTVFGADELLGIRLSEAKSAQEKFFFSVQWTREGLRAFQYPIVLWVTEQVAVGLGREAPDFWSWRGGVFEFVRASKYNFSNAQKVEVFGQVDTYMEHRPVPDHALETDIKNQIQALLASEPDSPLLASLYFSLGNVYRDRLDQGKAANYQQEIQLAIDAFQRAIELQEHSETVELAQSLSNLAGLYQSMGQYERALPLAEQALAVIQSELGDHHPDTASSLNNLAVLYTSMGQYDRALSLHEEALAIWKSKLGDLHPLTAMSLNNLALLYSWMGHYERALPLYEQALAINQLELGNRHPLTATNLNNLAVFYYNTNRLPEALAMMSEALSIREESLGFDHPDTVASRKGLEDIQRSMADRASNANS
jgi:tetratricopeptide (TPR) repeat protein